jgi:hypothetical protein
LTDLVAVIDEYKRRLVIANARVQEQDTILAEMAIANARVQEQETIIAEMAIANPKQVAI